MLMLLQIQPLRQLLPLLAIFKEERIVNEIQTDINKSVTNASREGEPKNSGIFLLNYKDENSFVDKLSHPYYQSTPRVFESEALKPL